MRWNLPTDGPKTLNGLIVEFLETIPEPGTTLKLADYMLEVLQTGDNAIKTVRIGRPTPAREAGAEPPQPGNASSAWRGA
jgi:Mg2+/Co2+ transporter CorB